MNPIALIKTEAQYEAALAEIDRIFNAKPGTEEGDRFELLAVLIELYEQKNHPVAAPEPIEAIKFRMDQMGMSVSDFGEILGYRSRASEVLSGKRKLSLSMMRRVHEKMKIPAEVLLQAY